MSQPGWQQAYNTPGNPADKEPAELVEAADKTQSDAPAVEQRIPTTQSTSTSDATPSSLGYGVRGAPAGEEARGHTAGDFDERAQDAEQMGAPGEGKVSDAVERKPGAGGAMPGLESDLDRKKAEQAELRGEVQREERREVDVGGVLGQTGGPANPVN